MFAALSLLAVGLLALSPSVDLPPVTQAAPAATGTVAVRTIPSFDAYPLEGRLYLPPDQSPRALVIYINGSGPNTNQNTRQLSANTTFSYFDLVASGFNEVGAAFFSYSTRGVTASDTPPFYHTITRQLSANTTFSYFDLVASGFNEVGAAFFSYSTRGVTASDTPPFYHTIDPQAYQTYLPSTKSALPFSVTVPAA